MGIKINVSRNAEGTVSNISVYQDYRYGGLTVITFMDSLEKWFLADEICGKLGYKVSSRQKILSKLSSLDKLILKPKNMNNFKCEKPSHLKVPNRGRLLINLHGLVILANNSTLPNARQYQDWVYSTITYIEDHGHYEDTTLADSMDRMNLLFNQPTPGNNPIVINQEDFRVIEIGLPTEIRKRVIDLAFYMTFSLRAYDMAAIARDFNINYLWLAQRCGGDQGRESVVTNIKFILDKLRLGWPIEELEYRLGNAFTGFVSKYSIPYGPGYQQRIEEIKQSEDPGRIHENHRVVEEEYDPYEAHSDKINESGYYDKCKQEYSNDSWDSYNPAYEYFRKHPEQTEYNFNDYDQPYHPYDREEPDEYAQYRKTEYDDQCLKDDIFRLMKQFRNK